MMRRDGPDIIDDLLNQNNASRSLSPAAVGSQMILTGVFTILTLLAFNILRPKNKLVYEPKVKYYVGDKKPPVVSDRLFGWLSPLIHTKEPELLDKLGLDAVAFLRFQRMIRWLFTLITIIGCAVLIPINVIYNLRHVKPADRDFLSMLTISDVRGPILFVHVGASYAFTFLVMALVWVNWRQMVLLRMKWFRSPEYIRSLYARTLMVRHVPDNLQSDKGIRIILDTAKVPYQATSVHVGRNVGRLPDLVDYHNQTIHNLEKTLVRYLKGNKLGSRRPAIRKGGCLGIGGTKYDAIDFYTKKIKRCEAGVECYREQIDKNAAENYGFASMASVPFAHTVARILRGRSPRGASVFLAPNPRDIIWENLRKSDAALASSKALGWLFLVIVCFLNTIPLLVVSLLANLASLTAYVDFLEAWSKDNRASFTIVCGILPAAIGAFFGWILPYTMRWLSRFQGATTRSRLDRAVTARYFAFLIISQLVIFTLIGVIINAIMEIVSQIGRGASVTEILDNLNKLPGSINRTYIDQTNFWLTLFPLRGFLAVFDLAQVLHLCIIWFKSRFISQTPRGIRECTKPLSFEYAIYYSNILFMCAVALIFAPIAPLVTLAAAIVFWINSWVYKYQLMYAFVTKVESGGRLWNVVINRLLCCVVFMQVLMVLTMGLQEGWRSCKWVSTVPPILLIGVFKVFIDRTFLKRFTWYAPSEEDASLAKMHSERGDVQDGRLAKRFGHPSLHAELFTPMLHVDMIPLLPDVYGECIRSERVALAEFGGEKVETSCLLGGIRIASVQENELEYDPVLYQRDLGEQDWDQKSHASTMMLGDTSSLKQRYSRASELSYPNDPRGLARYDSYLTYGPTNTSRDTVLSHIVSDTTDRQPLLQGQSDYSDVYLDSSTLTPHPRSVTSIPSSYSIPSRTSVRSSYLPYPPGASQPPECSSLTPRTTLPPAGAAIVRGPRPRPMQGQTSFVGSSANGSSSRFDS